MLVLKTIIFLIVFPGAVTILFPCLLLATKFDPFILNLAVFRFFGLLPILLGAAIVIRCFWDFIFTGEGTPAPIEPPKKLVVKGIYGYVRNPMYLGIAFVLFGEVFLLQSFALFIYALLVLTLFHLFVVFYEEPTLKKKFKDSGEEYFKSVPRWIPKLTTHEKMGRSS